MNLHGIFPPISTPFDGDELDVGALRSNIRRWVGSGLAGLVVLGSNGEAPYLDDDEAERVIATAREGVPSRLTLVAGTGRESTRATIAMTRRAAELGADAALVRTPSYFKTQMTTEAFVRHYTAVADASPIPILLYNFTAVTGVDLPVEAAVSLAEHPNVAGVKESNADPAKIAEIVRRVPPRFVVLAGSAHTLCASLEAGAAGAIVAAACVVPELCVRLYDLFRAGRTAEALAVQEQIAPIARLVTTEYGVPGLKAALDLAGYIGGDPRPPLGPAPPAAIERIRQALVALQPA